MYLTPEIIGHRLRSARENRSLTQEQVAEAIGLHRTALVQIESGNRSVSSLELLELAKLYQRDLALLLADDTAASDESLLVSLCRVTNAFASEPEVTTEINRYLTLFREGVDLERLLGKSARRQPPLYDFPEPRNYPEAVEQGETIATQERRRLNLASSPIPDIADLIEGQGIWASASRLPDELSGLFLHHPSIGMAILINSDHVRGRRRFSYAHEYAHSLADRKRSTASVTGRHNAKDLVERRANAFAGAFLVPAAGVEEFLSMRNKGEDSRRLIWLWDVATESGESFEKRNAPGTQTIGYQDVAFLAHEFVVSYDAALYRLSDLGYLTRVEVRELQERKKEGQHLITLLKLLNPDAGPTEEAMQTRVSEAQPRLQGQIGLLAVEALRRGFISQDRLLKICGMLSIEGQEILEIIKNA